MSKQALVIAIDYRGSSVELSGCEVDGGRMTNFFKDQGYGVTILSATAASNGTGQAPTKQNITNAIKALAAAPGLVSAAIFYAGHGTQIRCKDGSETDGLDECLVCQSPKGASVTPGYGDLFVDNDLLTLLRSSFSALDVDVFLMFDACHSGSMCDLAHYLGRDGKWTIDPRGFKFGPSDKCKFLCFSGAADSECALEAGSGGGLMTNKFLACVKKGDLSLGAFCREFSTMGMQTPHISAGSQVSMDAKFGTSIRQERLPQNRGPKRSSSHRRTGSEWRYDDGFIGTTTTIFVETPPPAAAAAAPTTPTRTTAATTTAADIATLAAAAADIASLAAGLAAVYAGEGTAVAKTVAVAAAAVTAAAVAAAGAVAAGATPAAALAAAEAAATTAAAAAAKAIGAAVLTPAVGAAVQTAVAALTKAVATGAAVEKETVAAVEKAATAAGATPAAAAAAAAAATAAAAAAAATATTTTTTATTAAAAAKAKEEADLKAKEEADLKAKEEAAKKAKEEADKKAADKKAKEEAATTTTPAQEVPTTTGDKLVVVDTASTKATGMADVMTKLNGITDQIGTLTSKTATSDLGNLQKGIFGSRVLKNSDPSLYDLLRTVNGSDFVETNNFLPLYTAVAQIHTATSGQFGMATRITQVYNELTSSGVLGRAVYDTKTAVNTIKTSTDKINHETFGLSAIKDAIGAPDTGVSLTSLLTNDLSGLSTIKTAIGAPDTGVSLTSLLTNNVSGLSKIKDAIGTYTGSGGLVGLLTSDVNGLSTIKTAIGSPNGGTDLVSILGEIKNLLSHSEHGLLAIKTAIGSTGTVNTDATVLDLSTLINLPIDLNLDGLLSDVTTVKLPKNTTALTIPATVTRVVLDTVDFQPLSLVAYCGMVNNFIDMAWMSNTVMAANSTIDISTVTDISALDFLDSLPTSVTVVMVSANANVVYNGNGWAVDDISSDGDRSVYMRAQSLLSLVGDDAVLEGGAVLEVAAPL
jgi:hypothetical protein